MAVTIEQLRQGLQECEAALADKSQLDVAEVGALTRKKTKLQAEIDTLVAAAKATEEKDSAKTLLELEDRFIHIAWLVQQEQSNLKTLSANENSDNVDIGSSALALEAMEKELAATKARLEATSEYAILPGESKFERRNILCLVDTSGSMHGEKLPSAIRGVRGVQRASLVYDRFGVAQFNNESSMVMKIQSCLLEMSMSDALDGMDANGGTHLLDAILWGISRLGECRPIPETSRFLESKNKLIVLTDGGENGSKASWEDVRNAVMTTKCLLHIIGIGLEGSDRSTMETALAGLDNVTYEFFQNTSHGVEEGLARTRRRDRDCRDRDMVRDRHRRSRSRERDDVGRSRSPSPTRGVRDRGQTQDRPQPRRRDRSRSSSRNRRRRDRSLSRSRSRSRDRNQTRGITQGRQQDRDRRRS